MDYLPIQASSVPCERVFSSSAETDTKKRNRTSPILQEALQMLKYGLRTEALNFMTGWLTSDESLVFHEASQVDTLKQLLTADAPSLARIITTLSADTELAYSTM